MRMSRTKHRFVKTLALPLAWCMLPPAFSLRVNPVAAPGLPRQEGSQPKSTSDSPSKAIEKDGIYRVTGPVLPPKLIHAPTPKYTAAARRARLEGRCILQLVVDTKGKPQNIRVKKSLDKGLDANAVKAARKYRFQPATMNGKPVPVEINVVVDFHML